MPRFAGVTAARASRAWQHAARAHLEHLGHLHDVRKPPAARPGGDRVAEVGAEGRHVLLHVQRQPGVHRHLHGRAQIGCPFSCPLRTSLPRRAHTRAAWHAPPRLLPAAPWRRGVRPRAARPRAPPARGHAAAGLALLPPHQARHQRHRLLRAQLLRQTSTFSHLQPGPCSSSGSSAQNQHLEARVEDELSEDKLIGGLDGGRHAPLQRHHALLIHIPAHAPGIDTARPLSMHGAA